MSVSVRKPLLVGVVSLCALIGALLVLSAPALALAPEEPKTEAVEAITNTTAELRGVVNPTSSSSVSWYFEYKEGISCEGGTRTPAQPEQGPEEVQARPVEAKITGLHAATTYTVCLVTENEAQETTVGNEVAVTTTALKPTVSEESFSTVTSSEATVSAQVNPEGLLTTYKVEYGTSEPYASSGEASLAAAEGAVGVVAHLAGLTPETEYHFRFVATNAFGSTPGTATPFTTAGSGTSSQTLPDGRAYEMVSPPDAHDVFLPETTKLTEALGGQNLESLLPFRASADGNAVAYEGAAPSTGGNGLELPGGSGNALISIRAARVWAAADVTPAPLGEKEITQSETYQAFSSDLSLGIVSSTEGPRGKPLVAGASVCDSLYARTGADSTFHAFFTTTPDPTPKLCGPGEVFAGASADGSHLLFETATALTALSDPAEGEGKENLYESVGGELMSVNVLDGQAVPNATFGSDFGKESEFAAVNVQGADFSNVISSDGSRVFWTDLNTNRIYVRENGATTVPVSAGEAHYWTATPDGRFVFYTEGEQLWRFAVDSATREALTPAGAEVQGVIGASADGTYVYFVAGGALTEGVAPRACMKIELQELEVQERFEKGLISEQEEQNALQGLQKERAEEGEGLTPPHTGCTLYMRHDGQTRSIATLAPSDDTLSTRNTTFAEYGDWQPGLGMRTAEVTPNGHAIVFESTHAITGNDNVVLTANGGVKPAVQAFVYDIDSERLSCASCNPSGAAPVGLQAEAREGEGLLPASALGNTVSTYMLRWLSEDGSRVFFESAQALVPQDTNGQADVYEWEREGTVSCPLKTPARKDGGCVFLLGAGSGNSGSMFVDASASGDDVFFVTRAKLLPQDRNENMKLYDARVGGGFPEPSLACTGAGCQGVPPAPPLFATPSSVTFSGVGNFPPPTPARPKTANRSKTEKLAKALKVCREKRDKHKRSVCEASARKKYGAASKKSKKASHKRGAK